MIVPTHAFREYDIRGITDRDLTDPSRRASARASPEVDQVVSKARAKLATR
jgi:hypothetical protein